jgi:hypothetical protein
MLSVMAPQTLDLSSSDRDSDRDTLAYNCMALITAIKSFRIQAPGRNLWEQFLETRQFGHNVISGQILSLFND